MVSLAGTTSKEFLNPLRDFEMSLPGEGDIQFVSRQTRKGYPEVNPAGFAELDNAIDRLKGTLAVLKFVEQRIPDRGTEADMAAISSLRVAHERLAGLASRLESILQTERLTETATIPSTNEGTGPDIEGEPDGRVAVSRAA